VLDDLSRSRCSLAPDGPAPKQAGYPVQNETRLSPPRRLQRPCPLRRNPSGPPPASNRIFVDLNEYSFRSCAKNHAWFIIKMEAGCHLRVDGRRARQNHDSGLRSMGS